ncbi:MAG: queuosine precursor transporter, partial [Leptolyngbya sp. SIO3F4]|nr:queuosine precursor transporter [Leptolyngbya sp. SIO3F4]
TDLISELYGQKRANQVVWVGLLLNLWVVFIVWLGGVLPGFEAIDPSTGELVRDAAGRVPVFFEIRNLTFGTVTASMIAYLTAQFVDVQLFHFWKELTQGKYLWLRNNGSTLVSQLVDTSAVILITHFFAGVLPIDPAQGLWPQLFLFIGYGYVFKLVAALLDTGPFYVCVYWLSNYLELESPVFKEQ